MKEQLKRPGGQRCSNRRVLDFVFKWWDTKFEYLMVRIFPNWKKRRKYYSSNSKCSGKKWINKNKPIPKCITVKSKKKKIKDKEIILKALRWKNGLRTKEWGIIWQNMSHQ